MRIRTAAATSVALAGSVLVLPLALPLTAAAHVTVQADDTSAGGWAKLTFRVPNESDTAGTTRLAVTLPTEAPFASVSVRPVPGWTAELQRQPLASPQQVGDVTLDELVTGVVWTAQPGVQLGPGQFDEFELSVGPLPEEAGTLSFPAEQGYSDGTTVLWDQFTPAGGEEPERPAPTIEVGGTSATAAEDGKGRTEEEKAARREERQAAKATATERPRNRDRDRDRAEAAADDEGDGAARALGATGLLLGAAGLGLGGYAFARSRQAHGNGNSTGGGAASGGGTGSGGTGDGPGAGGAGTSST